MKRFYNLLITIFSVLGGALLMASPWLLIVWKVAR